MHYTLEYNTFVNYHIGDDNSVLHNGLVIEYLMTLTPHQMFPIHLVG